MSRTVPIRSAWATPRVTSSPGQTRRSRRTGASWPRPAGGRSVILWNVADPTPRPTEIAVLPAYPGGVNALTFSPDGRTLASGYDDGEVVLWKAADPARGTPIATPPGQG